MGQTNGRIGPVNVLATSPAGAIGIDANVPGIDLDFDVVVDFRRDEHRSKGGMTPVSGIEW
jgi:hypothetical protein